MRHRERTRNRGWRTKRLLAAALCAGLILSSGAEIFARDYFEVLERPGSVAARLDGGETAFETVQADAILAEASLEGLGDDTVQAGPTATEIHAKSALLMEPKTGKIICAQNENEKMPPASVTKIMTLLLVMEALGSGKIHYEDMVTCTAHACSMGGSQIWLKENEQMSVHDLLKATAVASANDASVALAEHIAGTEESFVAMMNERAAELGMENTHFVNATGLDADGHLTTAKDIAIMSRELLKHNDITKYSTIWMDTLRDGATSLVNTNKLVRFYEGATGLKTGTTDGAGSCLSASAERDGMSLIAVVMGCDTSDHRFAAARALLDFGFANYSVYDLSALSLELPEIPVLLGEQEGVLGEVMGLEPVLLKKGEEKKITHEIVLPPDVMAPVAKGQKLGKVVVCVEEKTIGEFPILAQDDVRRRTLWICMKKLLAAVSC